MLEDQENRQEEKEDEPTRGRERERRKATRAANVNKTVVVSVGNSREAASNDDDKF